MLIDIDPKLFGHYFPSNPHPFLAESFINHNKHKAERIFRLTENTEKKEIGLVVGLKDSILQSPFSAPFGGFHFRNQIINISEIDRFLISLKEFIISSSFKSVEIILPPDIYNRSVNAKFVNSMIRQGFQHKIPDITGWIDLTLFSGNFSQKNSREYYRQALRHGLSFELTREVNEEEKAYEVIRQNRARFGRPIYMAFSELIEMRSLWPVDFFIVKDKLENVVAAAICYRSDPRICYTVFWGDTETGRYFRAMDYLSYNLWTHYKKLGFRYIDLGISTENGNPNEGLLRFKESHESVSSLRYKFILEV